MRSDYQCSQGMKVVLQCLLVQQLACVYCMHAVCACMQHAPGCPITRYGIATSCYTSWPDGKRGYTARADWTCCLLVQQHACCHYRALTDMPASFGGLLAALAGM